MGYLGVLLSMASQKDLFSSHIQTGYKSQGPSILLGSALYENAVVAGAQVTAPLKTFNRHGLIAGATGTGKTKTLQIIAERLSAAGVPSLVMDIKGDLSGIAKPGEDNARIQERQSKIGEAFAPSGSPVEFLSLSGEPGIPMRATVSEFGPILFSKILDLNETQAGVVSVLFKYCDDQGWPLLDLKDFKRVLNYATDQGKADLESEYGKISPASTSTILRKIVELEHQGAERFFGEPSFEVEDLLQLDDQGRGVVSILRLTDIQDKPKLFSTFMLCLLAEIYSTFPEAGDMEKPKLVIFIDEAHLIFQEASKALMNQIETIIKLIRSKGVGIFFCTQRPGDVPDAILSQLGMKVQHALRAFTAKDRKEIKLTAQNYPLSDFIDTEEALTSLGMGEALVTVLSEKGTPTPLAATHLVAPRSRMDVLTPQELDELIGSSELVAQYRESVDRESAYEILGEKMRLLQEAQLAEQEAKSTVSGNAGSGKSPSSGGRAPSNRQARPEKSSLQKAVESPVGKIVVREVTRGLLGVLGLKSSPTRRKKTSFF